MELPERTPANDWRTAVLPAFRWAAAAAPWESAGRVRPPRRARGRHRRHHPQRPRMAADSLGPGFGNTPAVVRVAELVPRATRQELRRWRSCSSLLKLHGELAA